MARSYLTIDVRGDSRLKAAASALGMLDRNAQTEVGLYLKSEMSPSWQPAVQSRARTAIDTAVLANTAEMTASGMRASLKSANRGGKLSGGFPITQHNPYGYATVEFGTGDREKVKEYTTRRHGRAITVRRHTARQMPPRIAKGRVVYPAASKFVPRVASLMVQTIIRTFHECFEE